MLSHYCRFCEREFTSQPRLVQHVNVVHGSNWNGVEGPWQEIPRERIYTIDEEPDVPTLLCS